MGSWQDKNQNFSLPRHPSEKKSDFFTREILAGSHPAQYTPPNAVFGKICRALLSMAKSGIGPINWMFFLASVESVNWTHNSQAYAGCELCKVPCPVIRMGINSIIPFISLLCTKGKQVRNWNRFQRTPGFLILLTSLVARVSLNDGLTQ